MFVIHKRKGHQRKTFFKDETWGEKLFFSLESKNFIMKHRVNDWISLNYRPNDSLVFVLIDKVDFYEKKSPSP